MIYSAWKKCKSLSICLISSKNCNFGADWQKYDRCLFAQISQNITFYFVFYWCILTQIELNASFLKLYFWIQKSVNVWILGKMVSLQVYCRFFPPLNHVTIPDPYHSQRWKHWQWKPDNLKLKYVILLMAFLQTYFSQATYVLLFNNFY